MDVQAQAFVKGDGGEEAGGGGAEVDHPPEEGATGQDDLGSEAEGPYEGQEVSLAALGAVCPLVEGRLDVVELVWGKAGL